MASRLWGLAALLAQPGPARGREYSRTYSFFADRSECDGQCMYCRHAHHHNHWAELRAKIANYVYKPEPADGGFPEGGLVGVRPDDVRRPE